MISAIECATNSSMTPLAAYFSKYYDVIKDLEVPDDVLNLLFFVEMDTVVR